MKPAPRHNPYKPSLGDRFWRSVWLSGREKAELEQDFHYAATVGKLWRAELLLTEKGVDIASGNNFAVRWAARGGHTEMLKLLFRHGGVDVNAKDGEPLINAVTYAHHACAGLLLDNGADVSRQDFKALRLAHDKKNEAMLAMLLARAKNASAVVAELIATLQAEETPNKAMLHLYQNYADGTPPLNNSPPPKNGGPRPQG
ncbi:MAG: ankyrin repeat domain-containing protein [Alphaproteobacteria bacterium]|nr:ankyrin repeat domain-containing protein [Alphaproteobacteria bacterium]